MADALHDLRSSLAGRPARPSSAQARWGAGRGLAQMSDATHERRRLTARQHALIDGLARGMTNKQIALQLQVAPGTVKTMLERLYRAAGVSGRAALVARYGRLLAGTPLTTDR